MMMSVRRATAADAALVSSLNTDVQALHAAALPWRFKAPGPNTFPPAAAASLLANPNHVVLIAELAGEPVGYACAELVRRSETTFHHAYAMVRLHHISVRQHYRRRGVGDALIAAVRRAGQEAGITLLTAEVWVFNEPACAFFRRHGLMPFREGLWDQPARE